MIDLDLIPGEKKLRQFGFIALGALALLAGWIYWRKTLFGLAVEPAGAVASALLAVGSLSGLFSALWPRANQPLYVLLALVSFPIGYVLSHVVLGIIFYLVLTPLGLFFRLVGRDPLSRRFDPEAESYWTSHAGTKDDERYFRQY